MQTPYYLGGQRHTGREYTAVVVLSPSGNMYQRLCLMTSTAGHLMYTHQMYYGFPLPAVEESEQTPAQPVMFEGIELMRKEEPLAAERVPEIEDPAAVPAAAAISIPVVYEAPETFERVYTPSEQTIADLQAQLTEAHAKIEALTRKHEKATKHIARLVEAEKAHTAELAKARKHAIVSYGDPYVDLPVLDKFIGYNETRGIPGGAAIAMASDLLGEGQAGVNKFVDLMAGMEIEHRDSK